MHLFVDSVLCPDTGRYSSGTSALCDRASTSVSRSSTVAHAQGRRRGADDDVDLDDEEYFETDQASQDTLQQEP